MQTTDPLTLGLSLGLLISSLLCRFAATRIPESITKTPPLFDNAEDISARIAERGKIVQHYRRLWMVVVALESLLAMIGGFLLAGIMGVLFFAFVTIGDAIRAADLLPTRYFDPLVRLENEIQMTTQSGASSLHGAVPKIVRFIEKHNLSDDDIRSLLAHLSETIDLPGEMADEVRNQTMD